MPELKFPDGFLWGSATSSHQVEGQTSNNDWSAWEQAGKVKEPAGSACDQYHRFEQDFDLAASLGHNAHRFSIEWSRVEPSEGYFDAEALEHYRQVIAALRSRGIEPIVTLHHFCNPQWLANAGGWLNPKVVDCFARYTQRVVQAIGPQVRYWLTINEPMVYMTMHYLDGVGPPGVRDLGKAFTVTEHLVRAHAAAFRVIHDAAAATGRPVQVSLAQHAQPFVPCRRWWVGDWLVAKISEQVYNHRFLEALGDGKLTLPGRKTVLIPEAQGTLDFLGFNYYSRIFMRLVWPARGQWCAQRCDTRHHPEVSERNAMGWDVYPPGIYDVLRWAERYKLPVLVTENGICALDDPQRQRFIERHVFWVHRAIEAGVPVFGYLYWSLLDNFEWAQGYGPRFGLIEVDYATQERRIRPSAKRFAEICRTNRLTISLR